MLTGITAHIKGVGAMVSHQRRRLDAVLLSKEDLGRVTTRARGPADYQMKF